MRLQRTGRLLVIIVVALATASGGIALAARHGANRRHRGTHIALAVLASKASAQDALPAGVTGAMGRRMGADEAHGRLALSHGDLKVYVAPYSGGVCLGSNDHAIESCVPSRLAVTEPAVSVVICSPFMAPDELLVYGTLPDGAADVRIAFADGHTTPVAFGGNTFFYRGARRDPLPTELLWRDAAGQQLSQSANVPGDAASERCGSSVTPAEAERALSNETR